MIHRSLFGRGSIFRPRKRSIQAIFNGHKPHHPNVRFFLYFAERSGPGCCCAWADKKVGSFVRFSRYGPHNGHLGSGLLGSSVGSAAVHAYGSNPVSGPREAQ